MRKRKKNELVYGWGINDVNTPIYHSNKVNGKRYVVWRCPYYVKWTSILQRCFDPKFKEKRPTYMGCTVCEEWKYFSNFKKWVDSQPNRDWQNCEPDKDILVDGNKHYGPETVVFITAGLNTFISHTKNNGCTMLGVSIDKRKKKPFQARCSNPLTGKNIFLGYYSTELEAHLAWKARKHEIACIFAEQQTDPRVADALRRRYTPDKDWINV